MDNQYTVQYTVHNRQSGAWQTSISVQTTDENTAIAKYGEEISRLWTSADFDFVCVKKIDQFGNMEKRFRDDRVDPNPPSI